MLAIHRRFYREFVEIQQTLSNLILGIEVCSDMPIYGSLG